MKYNGCSTIHYSLFIHDFFEGCEVPETMVNLPYMGTLADMSEAALYYCGYRISDCGLKQPKSKIRHPKSDQS